MKQFPIEILQPKNATLNAKIFKNDFLKIPATLFYTIEIELEEFEIENKKIETTIHLDFIEFNIFDLKELENQAFEFPINPENGFIDGSIYLFDVHNPIDVNKIEFSAIKNNAIEATIYFDINFELEDTGYKKVKEYILKSNLKFGNLSIDPDVMNAKNFNEIQANEMVSKFCNLNNYKKPKLLENKAIFQIKNL